MSKNLLTSIASFALGLSGTSAAPVAAHSLPASNGGGSATVAPSAQPNVLIWMLDDVGFAQISAYGGLVSTPNIDRVAARGIRYANYHSAPICSATRASFLTGRNPHSVHMGGHAQAPRPYPGYDGNVPADAGTIAANMHAAGYATFALGKWDHLPRKEMTMAGPFQHWPTQQGFDRFYGFLAADMDNWQPALISDTSPIPTPRDAGYHLNRDLADQAIAMISSRSAAAPQRPFFMYWATGTAHSPHHAPKEWIARYKGKFDMGWDRVREELLARQIVQGLVPASTKLAARPDGMPAWDSLSALEKTVHARQMEVFAASISYADAEFGRILDHLERSGELNNTIIMVTSDNGASAEGGSDGTYNEDLFVNGIYPDVRENARFMDKWGGPGTIPHYAVGWAVAGNTPFRYYKQTTYEGGMHVPLIVSWPNGIKPNGEIRKQFVSVNDIAPTLMDLAQVPLAPIVNNVKQRPMEGVSFTYSLAQPGANDRKKDQYFEMYGNKGLWSDGWTIVTRHRTETWRTDQITPLSEPWELYDMRTDPGQTTDLAAKFPDQVSRMNHIFEDQATRFNVNPIGNFGEVVPLLIKATQQEFAERRGKWVFPAPISHSSAMAAPPLISRPFRMTAEINLPTGRETGPIFAYGGDMGGMGLYLKDGVPVFILRTLDGAATQVRGNRALAKGRSILSLDFGCTSKAPKMPSDCQVALKTDDQQTASQSVKYLLPRMYGVAQTFDIGEDVGSPVTTDYPSDSVFPGGIRNMVFDFNGQK